MKIKCDHRDDCEAEDCPFWQGIISKAKWASLSAAHAPDKKGNVGGVCGRLSTYITLSQVSSAGENEWLQTRDKSGRKVWRKNMEMKIPNPAPALPPKSFGGSDHMIDVVCNHADECSGLFTDGDSCTIKYGHLSTKTAFGRHVAKHGVNAMQCGHIRAMVIVRLLDTKEGNCESIW